MKLSMWHNGNPGCVKYFGFISSGVVVKYYVRIGDINNIHRTCKLKKGFKAHNCMSSYKGKGYLDALKVVRRIEDEEGYRFFSSWNMPENSSEDELKELTITRIKDKLSLSVDNPSAWWNGGEYR